MADDQQREVVARALYDNRWGGRDMPISHWEHLRPVYLTDADAALSALASVQRTISVYRDDEFPEVQPDPLRAGVGEAVVEFRTRAQAYRGTGIGDAYHNAVSRLENLLAETEAPRA